VGVLSRWCPAGVPLSIAGQRRRRARSPRRWSPAAPPLHRVAHDRPAFLQGAMCVPPWNAFEHLRISTVPRC